MEDIYSKNANPNSKDANPNPTTIQYVDDDEPQVKEVKEVKEGPYVRDDDALAHQAKIAHGLIDYSKYDVDEELEGGRRFRRTRKGRKGRKTRKGSKRRSRKGGKGNKGRSRRSKK